MTAPADAPAESTSLRGPLTRFRVAAYLTGVGLLGLCLVMVLRYGFDNPEPSAIYSPIHGVVYMIYLVLAVDLAIKARWSVKGTVLVLLAGCVPFVSFLVERSVTRRVQEGRKI
jgi:integral membrane protein